MFKVLLDGNTMSIIKKAKLRTMSPFDCIKVMLEAIFA